MNTRREPLAIEATADVEGLLREIVEQVRDAGGSLHPLMKIVEESGSLHVECSGADGERLVHLPAPLLIPYEDDARRTPEQARLLDAHLELYRRLGKFEWYRSRHPRGALAHRPDAVGIVQRVRPRWKPDDSEFGFLLTRAIRSEAMGRGRFLMPVVDLLNHHSDSPGYAVDQIALDVQISRPTGTNQSFVRYNPHPDALDLALAYGFLDSDAPFVHSPPLEIEVAQMGTVSIGTDRHHRDAKARFPRVIAEPGVIRMSHLRIDSRHPASAREAVRLSVRSLSARQGLTPTGADAAADRAWSTVLDTMATMLERVSSGLEAGDPAGQLVAAAARRQCELLTQM